MIKILIKVIAVIVLIFALYTYIKYNTWKTSNEKFNTLYQEDKYDEASIVAQKELTCAEEIPFFSKYYIGPSLNNLGKACQGQKKYAEAESYYKRSLATAESVSGENSIEAATVSENMAKLYKETGKQEESQKLLEQSQKIKAARQ
ncbi:MAG: tetratricopeptide repeat protein [Candidatus Omnitrophota bacterium]